MYYVPVQGSALDNWKLKAFTGGGAELTAGAYPKPRKTNNKNIATPTTAITPFKKAVSESPSTK
jgi:hypothetical protein